VLRNELIAKARSEARLFEEERSQYWHFYRHRHGGPFLVIAKPGRRIIHLKGVKPTHVLWTFIEAGHPKHVGAAWEIRLIGDDNEVRAAFNDGLAKLIAS
jgi:hypothetical protein